MRQRASQKNSENRNYRTQKQENKELSSRRIGVEHLIGRIKIFRVASDRFRLARHKYEQVILSICGLVRVRMERKCILNADNRYLKLYF